MGVFVVNIRNEFLRRSNYRDYLCVDGIHPNEKGHSLMEVFFLDIIARRIPCLL